MEQEDFKILQTIQEDLQQYHGATQLQNIPEFTSSSLYTTLISNNDIRISLDLTVSTVIARISNILSAESVMFQRGRYQEQKDKTILHSQKNHANQRVAFYKGKYLHEWIQMIFSPQSHYFTIKPSAFISEEQTRQQGMSVIDKKKHNNKTFKNAIDTCIIDPENVSPESLETLGITLDPDCQNLKEIFKKMRPLEYQNADAKKHTVRIYEYDGKYIVFSAHKTVPVVTPPVTPGEQKMEDIQSHMSVYPDIFSLVRREQYIIDSVAKKIGKYKDIKDDLMQSINDIRWNKSEYSVRVQQNVREIIQQIDKEKNLKIMATKAYHLYKVSGRHCSNDQKLLEASLQRFAQRIAQLVGISSYTNLHLLELADTLEDQSLDVQSFHATATLALHKPKYQQQKDLFLLSCETYYNSLKRHKTLKQPFLTFAQQIQSLCGTTIEDATKHFTPGILPKASEIFVLQSQALTAYRVEHELNLEEITLQEAADELQDVCPGFSITMTKKERDTFFDTFKNLITLKKNVNDILIRK